MNQLKVIATQVSYLRWVASGFDQVGSTRLLTGPVHQCDGATVAEAVAHLFLWSVDRNYDGAALRIESEHDMTTPNADDATFLFCGGIQ